jgi:hypothetical protein
MKRRSFLTGMLTVLLAFGLAFVGCDNPSGSSSGSNTGGNNTGGGNTGGNNTGGGSLQEYFNDTPANQGVTQAMSADTLISSFSQSLIGQAYSWADFIGAGGELYVNNQKVTSSSTMIQPSATVRIMAPAGGGGGNTGGGDNTGGNNTGGDNTGGDNTGGNNTGGGSAGKVTITLLAGSGTGNIRLKLSEGTWNTSGSWDATESRNLNGIMNSLLSTSSNEIITRSQCTATVIESDTALNIELRNKDGLLAVSGEVLVNATLNPVTFPYTSHGTVSLSEKFQVAGDPVSFVNKTRLYSDVSTPWANGPRKIFIRESQIEFLGISIGDTAYIYAYNIDTWKSDYVGGQYCVTIDVSNGKRTSGSWSPACITDKTSFTFNCENDRIYIRQVNGETFSGTDGWDNPFTITK